MHVEEFQANHNKTEQAIRDAVRKAKEEDGAEGIILGCAAEFGFYQKLQGEFGLPAIDVAFACYKEM